MPFDIDFYLNPARGGIPAWPNRFAVMSWPLWLRFDPIAAAPHVTQPVLVIHSEDGAIPDGARRFLAALPHPGRAIWTDGTQFDFYDNPAHVTLAADDRASRRSTDSVKRSRSGTPTPSKSTRNLGCSDSRSSTKRRPPRIEPARIR
jgi:hypothetical protein